MGRALHPILERGFNQYYGGGSPQTGQNFQGAPSAPPSYATDPRGQFPPQGYPNTSYQQPPPQPNYCPYPNQPAPYQPAQAYPPHYGFVTQPLPQHTYPQNPQYVSYVQPQPPTGFSRQCMCQLKWEQKRLKKQKKMHKLPKSFGDLGKQLGHALFNPTGDNYYDKKKYSKKPPKYCASCEMYKCPSYLQRIAQSQASYGHLKR